MLIEFNSSNEGKKKNSSSFFIVYNYSSKERQSSCVLKLFSYFLKFTVIYPNDIYILNIELWNN